MTQKRLKLITEHTEEVKYLKEETAKGAPKSYFIEGIFMQAECVNKNGRRYPRDVMQNEVNRYVKEYVNRRRALGELSHPDSPTINEERVSHLITELRMDGDNVYGKAKLLDTPMGKIAKSFVDEGIQFGVSSRALGSLKEVDNGIMEVQDDFELATVDIVIDPSAPSAFVNGIMESKEWVYENGIVKPIEIDGYKKELKRVSSKDFNRKAVQIFERFLNQIKGK